MQVQPGVDPFDPTAPQIYHQFHTTVELLDDLISKSNKGMATMIEDSSTIVEKSQTEEGILMLHQMLAMITLW